MSTAADEYLAQLLARIPALRAVLLTDRDGVRLAGAGDETAEYLPAFSVATDQASKLGMGANAALTAFCEDALLVQGNIGGLVLSLLAAADGNVGLLRAVLPEARVVLEPLRAAVTVAE